MMSTVSRSSHSKDDSREQLDFVRWERLELLKKQALDAVGAHAVAARWLEAGDTERALEEIWMAVQWDACRLDKSNGLPGKLAEFEAAGEPDDQLRSRSLGLLVNHLKWRLQDKVDTGDFMAHHSSVTLDDLVGVVDDQRRSVEDIAIGRVQLAGLTADARAAGENTSRFIGAHILGSKNEQDRRSVAGLTPSQYKDGRARSVAVFSQWRERVSTIFLLLIPAAVLRRIANPTEARADAVAAVGAGGGGAALALKGGGLAAAVAASFAVVEVPKAIERPATPKQAQVVRSRVAEPVQRAVLTRTAALQKASDQQRAKATAAATQRVKRASAAKRQSAKSKTTTSPAAREFSVPTASSASSSGSGPSQQATVPTYTAPSAKPATPASREFGPKPSDSGSTSTATAASKEFK